jgi:ribonucleoside-triphosphate reductase
MSNTRNMTPYENFIATSRYARWLDDEQRRETWDETVDRYIGFMRGHLVANHNYDAKNPIFSEVASAIKDRSVMPSMRALMTAGEALDRNHIAGYNCAYTGVDDPRVFSEAVMILMSGTGLGFSVESKYTEQLPLVPESLIQSDDVVVVEDSKEGWANAYRQVIEHLYDGRIPSWDISGVRPMGARLKVFGGRASGPGPLVTLFNFTIDVFRKAAGRRLRPIECHDLMCMVGDIVVSGGVRRSALISLSDLDSDEMAHAKTGQWWGDPAQAQRALANNSAVYYGKPSATRFMREWLTLAESGSGERGIFNLGAAREHSNAIGRDGSKIDGSNPCAEILLRNGEFCNLTEVVIRGEDSVEDVKRKVSLAAVMGTWQASLTKFPYIRGIWRKNMEEERLLGVSLTGIYGNPRFNNPDDEGLVKRLQGLRKAARDANASEADLIGINRAAAITTVKPSGTVGQLVSVSSGIHPWYAPHFIRRVRGAKNDPMSRLMVDSGVIVEDDVTNPNNVVFSFPMAAPKGSVFTEDLTAIDHLRLYLAYRENWAEHTVSITVNVKEAEWPIVGAFVYDNFDRITGVSFLPAGDSHTYRQAPYEQISKDVYEEMVAASPESVRFADLAFYETEDGTTGNQTLACSASGCETVDLGTDDVEVIEVVLPTVGVEEIE